MQRVGIRELKARLSHYLREVARGVPYEVTDRGEVVAELRPPGGVPGESRYEARFRDLVRSGKLHPATRPSRPGLFHPITEPLPPGVLGQILDELKADRYLP
ncbi:MAG: type II toxin-antitoxin system prevent-host-death family antitoxin [Candidatus Sericytochromatia bacterium]|nr:type II toxin-antitoxin system prevent-host-death family antitoxin [Candidatus Tanganyikabacteria bacterium]